MVIDANKTNPVVAIQMLWLMLVACKIGDGADRRLQEELLSYLVDRRTVELYAGEQMPKE